MQEHWRERGESQDLQLPYTIQTLVGSVIMFFDLVKRMQSLGVTWK